MAATHSVTLDGLSGRPIEVEVDIANGMPATIVVGLADTIVNEARDRCRAAVVNSGTAWPDQRVTINLAPSTLPKSGSHYDLSRGRVDIVMRAAIYTRISSDRSGAGLGVDRQEADCREVADRLGWSVAAVYQDNDISAYSGKRRPGYDDLLKSIVDGETDAVIAWHPDRLHRRAAELEEFVGICEKHKTAVQTVQAGSVDLSSASGRMVARMLGAAAQHEIDHARERIQRAKAQAASEGRWRGGPRPFGYESDGVTLRPAEAHLLLAAARGVIAGRSLSALAREMNEKNLHGTRGQPWTGTRLRRTLQRPRNAGLMESRGEIIGLGNWPAVIPEDVWRSAMSVLNDPSRRTTTGPERRWLGSGIYSCGVCGGPLRVTRSNGRLCYRCPESHVSRVREAVDNYVDRHIKELLARESAFLQFRAVDTDRGEDGDELETLRARLQVFEADYEAGQITGRQLHQATVRAEAEIAAVEKRMSARSARSALSATWSAADPYAAYQACSLDRKRAIVSDLLRVTINVGLKGRPKGWTAGKPYTDLSTVVIEPGRAFDSIERRVGNP